MSDNKSKKNIGWFDFGVPACTEDGEWMACCDPEEEVEDEVQENNN